MKLFRTCVNIITILSIMCFELIQAQEEPTEENVHLIGRWADGPSYAVEVFGSTAYFGNGGYLEIVDFSDPANPSKIGKVLTPSIVKGIKIYGDYAYVANGTGGMRIIDVSNPNNAEEVGFSNNTQFGDWSYTNDIQDVDVNGSYAYVVNVAGLLVIDISDPTSPIQLSISSTIGYAYGIVVSGSHAYLADYHGGLRIFDISNPTNPMQVGHIDPGGSVRKVDVSGSYAYLATHGSGLRIIDISDPTNPTEIGYYYDGGYGKDVTVSGSYAYFASWDAGLKIIDISDPTSPTLAGQSGGRFAMGVAVGGSYAYLANDYNGLRIIDISNPTNPAEVSYHETGGFSRDVVVNGNYAYVAVDERGLYIIDISDRDYPVQIGHYYIRGNNYSVEIMGNYAYMGNGGFGSYVIVIDISYVTNPTRIGTYTGTNAPYDIAVNGDYVYVAEGAAGLRIIDLSNPSNPIGVSVYNTYGDSRGVFVNSNYAYLADGYQGLRIIDITDLANPMEIGFYDTEGESRDVFVSGNYAYVADGNRGLRIIDISEPTNPIELGYFITSSATKVTINGVYAYLADSYGGFRVIDISNPRNPLQVGYYDTGGYAYGVALQNGYAYLTAWDYGLYILQYVPDLTAPSPPQNLTATHGTALVVLRWDKNSEGDVAKYYIYGGTSTNSTSKIDSTTSASDTSKTIRGLNNGTNYYFRISAVDNVGNESEYSSEVSVTTNSSPVINEIEDITINEDTSIEVNLTATDVDGDILTFLVSIDTSAMRFQLLSNDILKLTPYENWNGYAFISVYATDGALFDTTLFTVHVNPVNDAPYLVQPLNSVIIDEDDFGAIVIPRLEDYFGDIDIGDHLTFVDMVPDIGLDSVVIGNQNNMSLTGLLDIGINGIMNGNQSLLVENRHDVSKRRLSLSSRKNGRRTRTAFSFFDDIEISNRSEVSGMGLNAESDTTSLIVYPTKNFNGDVRVVVTATDDSSASISDTLFLTIESINDPPTVFKWLEPDQMDTLVMYRGNEDSVFIFIWSQSVDVDNDTIRYDLLMDGGLLSEGQLDTTFVMENQLLLGTLLVEEVDMKTFSFNVFAYDGFNTVEASGGARELMVDIGPYQQGLSTDDAVLVPEIFALHQNYPNPFNPVTTLRYDLPELSYAKLTIYDILGRQVRTLVSSVEEPGFKSVMWDSTDEFGRLVSAGIYLYQIKAGEFTQSRKMLLIR